MPKTLLLADDSVTIQKVVGISFADEDVAITTVDNGDDALTRAHELHPDVILADVVMPGLSGYEVCEAVKRDPALCHIPVLLLTGTFEAFDEARAEAAGAAGHVAKPFEAQTLVDRVNLLLAETTVSAPEPAPRAAAAAPAAEAASADDAFDFFSDAEASADSDDTLDAEPLDLDGPDAAFAFDDDDLAPMAQEPFLSAPQQAGSPDATVAMLPDLPAATAAESDLDLAIGEDSAADLDIPMSPDALAHTTLLDPAAGSDLDVSSSDLAVDLSGPGAAASSAAAPSWSPEPPAATPASDWFEAAESSELPETDLDLTEPEPLDDPVAMPALPRDPVLDMLRPPKPAPVVEPPAPRPFGADLELEADLAPAAAQASETTLDPDDTMPRQAPPTFPMPAWAQPETPEVEAENLDPEPIRISQAAIADPVDPAPMPSLESLLPPPIPEAARMPVEDAPSIARTPVEDAVESASMPVEDAPEAALLSVEDAPDAGSLSPAMREELRDTLEKIAWDAFGQVTEKIVHEAIERIERVAWEVVPRLAETMIQEEIRRLKGGNSE